MIIDHIQNREKYQNLPWLMEALEAMTAITVTDFETGRLDIDGDRLFLNRIAYKTRAEEQCFFESHKKYTDVHFILSGEETLGYTASEHLSLTRAYQPADDAQLYEGSMETCIKMTHGWFAVFLPDEPHLTGLQITTPADVKKIVAKISH